MRYTASLAPLAWPYAMTITAALRLVLANSISMLASKYYSGMPGGSRLNHLLKEVVSLHDPPRFANLNEHALAI